jgi:hypothetical protein
LDVFIDSLDKLPDLVDFEDFIACVEELMRFDMSQHQQYHCLLLRLIKETVCQDGS